MDSTGHNRLTDIAFLLNNSRCGTKITHEAAGSESVQKEALIQLHMLMMQVKKCCETISNDEIPSGRYDALEISPLHIHKDKNAHKIALLTLGDEIVCHIHRHSMQMMKYPSGNGATKASVEH